jgi:Fe-S cluster assembly protein SufD
VLPRSAIWPDPLLNTPGFGFHYLDGQLDWLPGTVPAGVTMSSLKDLLVQPDGAGRDEMQRLVESVDYMGRSRAFEALNAALWNEGVVIHVAAGVDAGNCTAFWNSHNGSEQHLDNFRLIVRLEKGARLMLLDQHGAAEGNAMHAQPGESQVTRQGLNLMVLAELAPQSVLHQVRLQQDPTDRALLTFTDVHQAECSVYSYFGFDLGGGLVRHEMRCRLEGSGARAALHGAFVLDGDRLVDHHLSVDHLAPGCSSEQYFRGVLAGRSRGVFNGKALIRPGADGSKVRQSSANLLLSDLAEMDTKPELEIYADEVEARHGATVGQLDEQAIFYLRARGLSQAEARRMLISAFCRAVSSRLANFVPNGLTLGEHIGRLLDASTVGSSSAGLGEEGGKSDGS